MLKSNNIYREIAAEIVSANPNKECYTCTCGIGPTGIIHFGKAFDIICSTMVCNELISLGKKAKVLCVVDDCIPAVRAINKAVYIKSIEELKKELEDLKLSVEFVFSSHNYSNHIYDEYLKTLYEKRNKIYDVLGKFDLSRFTRSLGEIFYTYCPVCGSVINDIAAIGDLKYKYNCTCGKHSIESVLNGNTYVKWKIENVIRWHFHKSSFEPAAFNHGEKNGSFTIAKEVYKQLYEGEAPKTIFYPFICDSNGAKFSISKGIGYTIGDLLECFYPDQILNYFSTLSLSHNIKFSLQKMFDAVYSPKFWVFINKSNGFLLDLGNETTRKIINASKYYFYNSNVISKRFSVKKTKELELFISKIKRIQERLHNTDKIMPCQLKTVLSSLLNDNGNIEGDENANVQAIKKWIALIPNYSWDLFCKDFYQHFFNSIQGPPIMNILSECRKEIAEKANLCCEKEYAPLIIKPEGIDNIDSIMSYILSFGIAIKDYKRITFDEELFGLIYNNQEITLKQKNKKHLIGKEACFVITSGFNIKDRIYYLSGTNGNPEFCSNTSLRYLYHKGEKNGLFLNAIHRCDLKEEPTLQMLWYFKVFIFKEIEDDIIKLLDTPDNKSRYQHHIAHVVENVKILCEDTSIVVNELKVYYISISAWLHDIAKCASFNLKLSNTSHAEAGAQWAREYLSKKNVCDYFTEMICKCISNHTDIPAADSPIDIRILAAADGMAHIDYPWIMLCNILKKNDLSYEQAKTIFFETKLNKSLNKITFDHIKNAYKTKIDLLRGMLK